MILSGMRAHVAGACLDNHCGEHPLALHLDVLLVDRVKECLLPRVPALARPPDVQLVDLDVVVSGIAHLKADSLGADLIGNHLLILLKSAPLANLRCLHNLHLLMAVSDALINLGVGYLRKEITLVDTIHDLVEITGTGKRGRFQSTVARC